MKKMSIKQVAKAMSVSVSLIDQWYRSGYMPSPFFDKSQKQNRQIRYWNRSDIQNFCNDKNIKAVF